MRAKANMPYLTRNELASKTKTLGQQHGNAETAARVSTIVKRLT